MVLYYVPRHYGPGKDDYLVYVVRYDDACHLIFLHCSKRTMDLKKIVLL